MHGLCSGEVAVHYAFWFPQRPGWSTRNVRNLTQEALQLSIGPLVYSVFAFARWQDCLGNVSGEAVYHLNNH